MSSAHAHGAEVLAQTSATVDPTRSQTLRKRYAQRLRGAFQDINVKIRQGVQSRDVFNLGAGASTLAEDLPTPFPRRRDRQIETFDAWLERQQANDVLEVISRGDNQFVRSAYGKGVRHAETALRRQGLDVPETALHHVFNRPVHADTLRVLYQSDYSDLEGITAEVSKQSNRVLTQGFAEGVSPSELSRRLTDRVNKIGKTRATALARTSVIDAHAQATLNRYENFGVESVTVRAELRTAGDNRVCEQCQALEGRVYSLDEARGVIPVHVSCRCSWVPVTS